MFKNIMKNINEHLSISVGEKKERMILKTYLRKTKYGHSD